MRLWMMLALAGVAIGCTDSVDRNLEKREMDRISYRNSELRRQVDEKDERLAKLQSELDTAQRANQELRNQLSNGPEKSSSTTGPSTRPR